MVYGLGTDREPGPLRYRPPLQNTAAAAARQSHKEEYGGDGSARGIWSSSGGQRGRRGPRRCGRTPAPTEQDAYALAVRRTERHDDTHAAPPPPPPGAKHRTRGRTPPYVRAELVYRSRRALRLSCHRHRGRRRVTSYDDDVFARAGRVDKVNAARSRS